EATRYPYQFAGNYAKFAATVYRFPVDAHMLVALIAPRPVLLQTGDKDFWSDPKGGVSSRGGCRPGVPPARQAGSRYGSDAARGVAYPAHHRLLYARRRAWHDPIRLGSVPG